MQVSSPWRKSRVAPRLARRPADKARGGRISGIFDRRATQSAGMTRRSNAAGLLPRAASPWLLAVTVCLLSGASIAQDPAGSREYPPDLSVSLSPDGELLALSNDSGLWIMPIGGGTARPLLPTGTVARYPSFSPDGTVLVYQSSTRNNGTCGFWNLPGAIPVRSPVPTITRWSRCFGPTAIRWFLRPTAQGRTTYGNCT